jgi:uncharacterized protein
MSIKSLVFAMAAMLFVQSHACAEAEYNIVTASERGTYIQIGKDIAKYVAEPSGIRLKVLPSNGSVENVKRLRDEDGTKFALVQSDVYQAFQGQAAAGNVKAGRLIEPLRVIAPLYDEEIYLITRADSPLNYFQDIQDKRINIGPLGSGSAMTSSTLYKLMFNSTIPSANVTTFSNEEALVKLVEERSLDVVVVVAGQPVKLFVGMDPGVEKYFKFLKFDSNAAVSKALLATYSATVIKASSYPKWLAADSPTLAVKTLLVTYDYRLKTTKDSLVQFARSLCKNLPLLQKEGHTKWQQVDLQLPALSDGLTYYPPTERELRTCKTVKKNVPASHVCSLQDRIMGLCSAE